MYAPILKAASKSLQEEGRLNQASILTDAAAEIESLTEALKAARAKLRSTTGNWQEPCLFECDDILTKAIGDES